MNMLDENHTAKPSQCHNHATTGLSRIITVWYLATEMLDLLVLNLVQHYQISGFPRSSNLSFSAKKPLIFKGTEKVSSEIWTDFFMCELGYGNGTAGRSILC
jgi:hypothetical protein